MFSICMHACVCVCVCVRARARARACVRVCVYAHYVCVYVHTLPNLYNNCVQKVQQKYNFAYVRSVCTYIPLYLYTERSPVRIKSPAHQNLISCSMTALSHALSPSSTFLSPHSMHLKYYYYYFNFVTFLKLGKSKISKL